MYFFLHIHITRIKDEIRFLHKKKQKLNTDLYNTHLKAAHEWGNLWYPIILGTVKHEADKKYRIINAKLNQLSKTQSSTPEVHKQFYPRVINNTNITLTNDEIALLNKGPRYNLGHKNKGWITTLALEAETAVSQLTHSEQEHMRHQVAHNIKQLYKKYDESQPNNTKISKKGIHIINKIKRKLMTNNAMIAKADKGNSIIIIPQHEYHEKIKKIINDHSFSALKNEPTKTFQRELRNIIKKYSDIITKEDKWRYVNLNPAAPTIRGLIKIHKPDATIRPTVNWKQASAYKTAKLLIKKLTQHLPLPNTFNVKNSVHLIQDLAEIPFNPNIQFVSFDIKTCIPTYPLMNLSKS
jgi:hypothetical protein